MARRVEAGREIRGWGEGKEGEEALGSSSGSTANSWHPLSSWTHSEAGPSDIKSSSSKAQSHQPLSVLGADCCMDFLPLLFSLAPFPGAVPYHLNH